jgi:hypothetical protein
MDDSYPPVVPVVIVTLHLAVNGNASGDPGLNFPDVQTEARLMKKEIALLRKHRKVVLERDRIDDGLHRRFRDPELLHVHLQDFLLVPGKDPIRHREIA